MTELGVPVPGHLARFVEVLGADEAVKLVLAVGGSEIYLPRRSSKRTPAAKVIGADNVVRLAAAIGHGYIKVPLARRWCAAVLRAQGKSDNEIARLVRADRTTVNKWLGPRPDPDQLALPL